MHNHEMADSQEPYGSLIFLRQVPRSIKMDICSYLQSNKQVTFIVNKIADHRYHSDGFPIVYCNGFSHFQISYHFLYLLSK